MSEAGTRSVGDMTELTESERDFRLKVVADDEEQRRLDDLLTQCHDYIYSSLCHVTSSSKIITNGSLTARTPQHDVTSGVMAACWLELPAASSSRDAFPFPTSDVTVDRSAVTSHIHGHHDDVRTTQFRSTCRKYLVSQ